MKVNNLLEYANSDYGAERFKCGTLLVHTSVLRMASPASVDGRELQCVRPSKLLFFVLGYVFPSSKRKNLLDGVQNKKQEYYSFLLLPATDDELIEEGNSRF